MTTFKRDWDDVIDRVIAERLVGLTVQSDYAAPVLVDATDGLGTAAPPPSGQAPVVNPPRKGR